MGDPEAGFIGLLEYGSNAGVTAFVAALIVSLVLYWQGFRLQRRGLISKSLMRLGLWCILLCILFPLDIFLDRTRNTVSSHIVSLFMVFGIGLVIVHGVNVVYGEMMTKMIRKRPVNQFHLDLTKFFLLLVYAFFIFKFIMQVDLGSLFTSSAIITAVAVFSMQDTINSIVSGLILQMEKPFSIGDRICVAGMEGACQGVTWRYTTLKSPDSNLLVIPNNLIIKEKIVNFSSPIPEFRLHLRVGVSFDVPPVKVKAALAEVLAKSPLVCKAPAPEVRLKEFAESKAIYELAYYAPRYDDAGRSQDEVLAQVWYQFKKDGISLPYPARDIRMRRKNTEKRTLEIVTLLRRVPLFSALPDNDLELLAMSSLTTTLPAGRKIVSQGEKGATLFIILEGEVSVSRDNAEVARLQTGDFFGEMALLTGEPRQADVAAVSETMCLEVDREGFRVILEKKPETLQTIQQMFASRRGGDGQDDDRVNNEGEGNLFQRFLKIFNMN
ncbi:MAG: mechanosensitive ion channel family protein [Desulfovibrionaceae bacterium]|nr:mechanosensitive ion channel family protein [Desulfovibrionaceae bacterium]MBF0513219.1 mechanosensitive ion channel family protein [Desulfovibrionaceae bacterium]